MARRGALCGGGVGMALALGFGVLPAPVAARLPFRVTSSALVSQRVGPMETPCPVSPRPRTSDHSLAADPLDADHLAAAWMQDRPGSNSGGAPSLSVGMSNDGGRSWTARRLAGLSRCDGGNQSFVSVNEAQVRFGFDGTLYLTHHPQERDNASRGKVAVVRSSDGGRHFGPQVVLGPEDTVADQAFVTPDPTAPQHVYANWHDLEIEPSGNFPQDTALYFAETVDSGNAWSAPRLVRRSEPGRYDVASHLVREPDGTLVLVYAELSAGVFLGPPAPGATDATVRATRSTDGGQTWQQPVLVASLKVPAVVDPDTGEAVNLFSNETVAAAPDGTIYVAFRDVESTESSSVRVVRSSDGGLTWEEATPPAVLRAQAFLPEVAVRSDGVLAVSFLDFRNDKPGDDALTTDAWIATSGDRGDHWTQVHALGPFDTRPTIVEDESLIGDTGGLAPTPDAFVASFNVGPPLARRGDTDLMAIRITDAPPRIERLRVLSRRRVTRFRFRLSDPAKARLRITRRGTRVLGRRVSARYGENTVRVRRSKLTHRCYRAELKLAPGGARRVRSFCRR